MSQVSEWLLRRLLNVLGVRDPEAIVGDMLELGTCNMRAVFDVLASVIRGWLACWNAGRPWVTLIGVVLPAGILLSGLSSGLSIHEAMQLSIYWRFGSHFGAALPLRDEIISLAFQSVAVFACAWCSGLVLQIVSPRTSVIQLLVLYTLSLFFGAQKLISPRMDTGLSLFLEFVLFVVPSACGAYFGARLKSVDLRYAVISATAIVTLSALATWTESWRETALERWSEGAYHETAEWQEKVVPLVVLSWPAIWILGAWKTQGKAHEALRS